MKLHFSSRVFWALFGCCMLLTTAVEAASFSSADNLVVVRLDNSPGASAAQGVQLKEYDVSGPLASLVQTISIDTSGASSLTMQGLSNHDGLLNRSVDGRYLTFAGYRVDAGAAFDPTTSASATNPRVIGRVGGAGHADTSTALADSY